MKKYFFLSLLAATAVSGAAHAGTIFEAWNETYKSNPTLQAQRAYLRAIDENVAIAKSGYRPNIYLNGSYTESNVSGDQDYDEDNGSIAAKISQPIFSGFQTVNSVKAADSTVKAEQNNLYSVEQDVLLSASTAYLNVVRDEAIVKLQKNNEKLLKKRLDETIQRFNVGEVTRTDVSQARARHSQAQADRITSEGNLQASKAEYMKVIGSAPENLSYPEDIKKYLPASMDEAYNYAIDHNYTVKQAKNMLKAQTYNVAANNGALLPSVTLDGTASKNTNDNSTYDGKVTTDNLEWGVNLRVPLYNSGESRAKIRQSKYQKWQAQEQVMEAERVVRSSVESAWEYMVSNEAKITSIKDQVKANEIALDGVQKEEALGNRTILDVLDAYQELLSSNVEEVKARRDYFVSGMELLVAMGKLTAKDLNLDVDIYDPNKYYEETKDKWLSLSIDK